MSHAPRCRTWSCALAVAVVIAAAPGCGGSSFDPKSSPYGEPTLTTLSGFAEQSSSGSPLTRVARVTGTKTVNGTTYAVHLMGDAAGTSGSEFWFNRTGDTIEFGGFTDNTTGAFTLDAPLKGDLNPPVGQVQEASATGTFQLLPDPTQKSAQATATATLVDNDASVDTAMGTLHGCRHFTGTGNATGDGVPNYVGAIGTVDLWYHPQFGLVAANVPSINWSTGITGTSDCGSPDSATNTLRQVAILDATNPSFQLSTYDCYGQFDADKDTHAQMLLELRWLDEAKAKTDTAPAAPMVNVEFGTVFGIYAFELTESPVSIFHPQENGKGYKYWTAYVSQADRYQSQNGIEYHIKVAIDTAILSSALRATGRIYYHRYKP